MYKSVGIDHSLNNTGVAIVWIGDNSKVFKYSTHTIHSNPKDPIEKRLAKLSTGVLSILKDPAQEVHTIDGFGIENYSRGSQFRREEMGMSFAAAMIGSYRFIKKSNLQAVLVTPQQHKVLVCPNWHGTNKINWEKSGRTGKFKRSMPDKISTMSALFAKFGIKVTNDHESDAAAIALFVAHKNGGLVI